MVKSLRSQKMHSLPFWKVKGLCYSCSWFSRMKYSRIRLGPQAKVNSWKLLWTASQLRHIFRAWQVELGANDLTTQNFLITYTTKLILSLTAAAGLSNLPCRGAVAQLVKPPSKGSGSVQLYWHELEFWLRHKVVGKNPSSAIRRTWK